MSQNIHDDEKSLVCGRFDGKTSNLENQVGCTVLEYGITERIHVIVYTRKFMLVGVIQDD